MARNLHEFFLRIKALFLRRRMDRDMADELAFHQAMLRDKLIRQGNTAIRSRRRHEPPFRKRRPLARAPAGIVAVLLA